MAFSNPESNISQLGIKDGSSVADLGAGSGFYTIAAARVIGPHGRVYAIDVQKDLLAKLKNTATASHLFNIETIAGDVERVGGTRLTERSQDFVIASNLMFQVEDKEGFVKEIKRIIKPTGKVLLVDWSDSFGGMGPAQEHVVKESDVQALFEKVGFKVVSKIEAGDHHYGFIFSL